MKSLDEDDAGGELLTRPQFEELVWTGTARVLGRRGLGRVWRCGHDLLVEHGELLWIRRGFFYRDKAATPRGRFAAARYCAGGP